MFILFIQYLTNIIYFVKDRFIKLNKKLITEFFAINFVKLFEILNNTKI